MLWYLEINGVPWCRSAESLVVYRKIAEHDLLRGTDLAYPVCLGNNLKIMLAQLNAVQPYLPHLSFAVVSGRCPELKE